VEGIARGTSFVFQADALLPWKTVLANVAMGPLFHGASKKDAHAQARDWLRRVGLAGFEHHHPHQLSGGMRKRVGLAAALINEPSILLMDEPFGALDVQTKAIMSNELLGLWEQTRPSVIFVTHDLEEAIALADRVVVMTVGPGTVKGVYEIDLPRPRGEVQEIRFEPRFLELHQEIWESLRDEVRQAYARTAGTGE
jgi:NitT/TauT family transport system ATP-binding protein